MYFFFRLHLFLLRLKFLSSICINSSASNYKLTGENNPGSVFKKIQNKTKTYFVSFVFCFCYFSVLHFESQVQKLHVFAF